MQELEQLNKKIKKIFPKGYVQESDFFGSKKGDLEIRTNELFSIDYKDIIKVSKLGLKIKRILSDDWDIMCIEVTKVRGA